MMEDYMKEINEKLYSVKSRMRERDRVKGLIQRCEEQKSMLKEKRDVLLKELKKEELDVQKLEGVSIAGLIHMIKGDKEERLNQEKKEVLSAKLKYDEACKDIDSISKEILSLNQKIDEFNNLGFEYDRLISEKQRIIKNQLPEMNKKFEALMEEKIHMSNKQRETKEAIKAGDELLNSLENVRNCLSSASNWGVYDMLGGGFIATMAKHDRIDDAKHYIDIAQSHLRKFHRELSDIDDAVNIDLEKGSFLSFADYFFDSFFVDWAVQSRIDDALSKTVEIVDSVSNHISKLDNELRDIDKKLIKLEQDRLEMIEKT
jgi:hypothetical protein